MRYFLSELDRRKVETQVRTVSRSSSRATVVSIPFRKPFMAFAGRTGTSSMRSSYRMACTFWPDRSLSRSRMPLGMTT